ncbi:CRISPR-associated protein Csx14 [Plasticicumulans lactativorans]|uniref:CRISPR-associated protein Csx14 n=1 Tax=Plasticicumulans lactativorans TaxID=1133106 RepID=A0A4R2L334_9GAMM|nr:hypothetical protein [Plasticicumulans lactativorans]TCO79637.1 CRISPR-associated protein Csx14 [Plasticicumulans lactativorans]
MQRVIDLRNPGEVLACGGLAWLASLADPLAETGFEPMAEPGVMRFACPDTALQQFDAVRVVPVVDDDDALQLGALRLDWWNPWGLNPHMKLWSGKQKAESIVGNLFRASAGAASPEWLEFEHTTTGRLGVDPRGTWNALGIGWSINQHTHIEMLCRPLLELLAFIGLQALPLAGSRRDGHVRLHPWREASFSLARLAIAGASRYALSGWRAPFGKAGSNTILLTASPD